MSSDNHSVTVHGARVKNPNICSLHVIRSRPIHGISIYRINICMHAKVPYEVTSPHAIAKTGTSQIKMDRWKCQK